MIVDNHRDASELIFQQSLELIQSGQETIDSVVARYPEFADTLRHELETALWVWSFNKSLDPRPGFVAASRRRLVERIKQEGGLTTTPARKPKLSWRPWLHPVFAPLAFVLVLLISLSTVIVAMAAQSSLPGDDLYPVKIAWEKVTLEVTTNKSRRAQLALQYTHQRFSEIHLLIEKGRGDEIHISAENLEDNLSQAIQSLSELADQNKDQAQEMQESLEDKLWDEKEFLDERKDALPEPAKLAIIETIQVVDEGLGALEEGPEPPTPTATPVGIPTSTPLVIPSSTPTQVVTPTLRPSSASTNAPQWTATSAPTEPATPTVIPSNTPVPPPTRTSTPTRTSSPKDTNTPQPTPTVVVPTNTPAPPPTDVPTPTPVDTPIPPDTPTTPPYP